ncbi:MAG: hypothetical protein GEU71_05240 [Actinobacteria bacterium]|nr:hypothetical protein [Actinomycetota bacterium]
MNKILILVLVVIAVVFAVGIAAGTTHDDDDGIDTEGSFVEDLKDSLLGETKNVPPGDIISNCREDDGLVLFNGQSCTARIGEGGYVRDLALQALSGSVRLSFLQKDQVTIRKDLAAGDDLTFQVFKEGGSLLTQCLDPAGCALAIIEDD